MVDPQTARSVDEFTVEHVRMLIDPKDATTVSLTLFSGMFPPTGPANGINAVFEWFGRNLVPYVEHARTTPDAHMHAQCRRAIAAIDTTTNQVPVCVLDLLRVRHTAAARQGLVDGGSSVFGTATLSASPGPFRPRFSLDGSCVTPGQLHATFAASTACEPNAPIDALAHAVGIGYAFRRVVDLDDIIGGRAGEPSGIKHTKAKTVATYADDIASIWRLTPQLPGHDLIFDTFHMEYADTPVYRVFKAAPAPESRAA